MSKFSTTNLFLAAFLAVSMPSFGHEHDGKTNREYRSGELIVKFKPGTVSVKTSSSGRLKSSSSSALDAVMRQLGVEKMEKIMPLTGKMVSGKSLKAYNGKDVEQRDLSELYTMKYDTTKQSNIDEAIEKLQALDGVEFVEPNYIVRMQAAESAYNDPLYSEQWGVPAIKLDQLWAKPKITTKRSVIAILDTGVDVDHPDLADNIWTNEKEKDGEEDIDDDGNGFADDIHGWDFINQTGIMRDNNGHGTHCAGIAAAVGNNSIGVVGANPDALIMPVAVLQSDGIGDIATIIKGVDYAAANGADIISMSFGTYGSSIAFEQALGHAYSTSVLVAAAGNDGACIYAGCHQPGPGPMFPAAYGFVIGVEATEQTGNASFSNYDCDGPFYTRYDEEKLYNYEVKAPGVGIMSTYPKGRYKSLNGTSMACPLVAGAISVLMERKEYSSKEILFGDLVNSTTDKMDVLEAFQFNDENRKPFVQFLSHRIDDSLGDGDGRYDAGEEIHLYPLVRNYFGNAENIEVTVSLDENEDPDIIDFIQSKISFGKTLSAYSKSASASPLIFKIADNCADGRHISLVLRVKCEGQDEYSENKFVITVENGVELGGVIDNDLVLYPNVHYIVTKNLGVPEGITLEIKPGTSIEFKPGVGMSIFGNLICNGTPDSLIYFSPSDFSQSDFPGFIFKGNISYACFDGFSNDFNNNWKDLIKGELFENCIFKNLASSLNDYFISGTFDKCNFYNNTSKRFWIEGEINNSNMCNNVFEDGFDDIYFIHPYRFMNSNTLNNYRVIVEPDSRLLLKFNSAIYGQEAVVLHLDQPCYYGSSVEKIIRDGIKDSEQDYGFVKLDLSNCLQKPSADAHGIVWKVNVNGFDAQDEFEHISALGPGKHKFEVYFNRPMDVSVTPKVSMGVRAPYTQTSISEDGAWSADSMVYTAYLTITAKSDFDGLNRIRVYGAKDNEHFDIPEEYYRFNVMVQKAGSMSTGLEAIAGLGKVTLNWETDAADYEDLLGYNLYRYSQNEVTDTYWGYNEETGEWADMDSIRIVADTILLNTSLLEPTDNEFVDFAVTPGKNYYYFIKQMSTDMSSSEVSKVVAATPLSSIKGDANGSMTVDVADVVTEVAYLTKQNPEPFIFESADVNSDEVINILDVVGTVNIIMNPSGASSASADNAATYSIEDGILYVETVTPLAGVQVTFEVENEDQITALEGLNGMEKAGTMVADNEYMLLAYSMAGKSIATGKHALAKIGDSNLKDIVICDIKGKNVEVIEEIADVDAVVENASHSNTEIHYYDLSGKEISKEKAYNGGVCILTVFENGKVMKSYKFINKK